MTEGAEGEDGGVRETPVAYVGVGASAGGLPAIIRLLEALPPDTGLALIIVSHLSPDHESLMAELLSRRTTMRVIEVQDEPMVLANHVYVIPPARGMVIRDGNLRLFPRTESGPRHRPIDWFLEALAQDQEHRAIGVILSGTGNDGTSGLAEIKAHGGITFAQDDSAQHQGMPESAVSGGAVDIVASPEEIADRLAQIAKHPRLLAAAHGPTEREPADLRRILTALYDSQGVDFNEYKRSTLYRRITRRMILLKLADLSAYAELLEREPSEVVALYRDILINVTCFFRNPDVFEQLKASVFPAIIAGRTRDIAVRMWSLGCSTGEEAYSLAMAMTEYCEAAGLRIHLQVFGTDVNDASIDVARTGTYPRSIATDVSPERLRRFFVETPDGYRVTKAIREMCVFARHNVIVDPPFSRVHLVSCRNLLIYLEPGSQKRVIGTVHYALVPDGVLWLGTSETVGPYRDLFAVDDSRRKIYRKRGASPRTDVGVPVAARPNRRGDQSKPEPVRDDGTIGADLMREADRILLGRFSPPAVLLDANLDIVQFRGDTSRYLTPAPGKASFALLRMLREGLVAGVHGAIGRARSEKTTVRENDMPMRTPEGTVSVSIEVIPMRHDNVLLLFDDSSARPTVAANRVVDAVSAPADVTALLRELAVTKEYLQSLVQQQEAANEELQSANEEIQSNNEELQSINEELETSKEEVQSTNEELATVNDELNARNLELGQSNNDLLNLIASVEVAIVMLGPDLRIRRFTPTAERLLNLIAGDLGRVVTDIKLNVHVPDIENVLTAAVTSAIHTEREVQARDGTWYSLRVRPYRTTDRRIDGAVMMLVDVDSVKRAEEAVRESEARFRMLADSAPVLIWIYTGAACTFANRAYHDFIGAQASGSAWAEFVHPDDRDAFVAAHAAAALERSQFQTQVRLRRADGAYRWMKASAVPRVVGDQVQSFVGSYSDITDLKEAEESLRRDDRRKNEFLAMLAHELRNPLAPLHNAVQLLRTPSQSGEVVAWAWEVLTRQLNSVTRMVDDLLDVSRITHGKIALRTERLDVVALLRRLVEQFEKRVHAKAQNFVADLPSYPIMLNGDPVRLEQAFGNLLNNAIKFTPTGGRIWLSIRERPGVDGGLATMAEICIGDSGEGMSDELLQDAFGLFVQGDRSLERTHGGLGIGLTVVRRLVTLHGGTVDVVSEGPGKGTLFTVRLPLQMPPSPVTADVTHPRTRRLQPIARVLVVDDNRDAAETLGALLRAGGYDVDITVDGRSAIVRAIEFKADAIILDIGLPGQNGFDVARELRSMPETRDVTIVAVTGYGGAADRARALAAGIDDYLTKPTSLDALRAALT